MEAPSLSAPRPPQVILHIYDVSRKDVIETTNEVSVDHRMTIGSPNHEGSDGAHREYDWRRGAFTRMLTTHIFLSPHTPMCLSCIPVIIRGQGARMHLNVH